jgi:hypothetical protein
MIVHQYNTLTLSCCDSMLACSRHHLVVHEHFVMLTTNRAATAVAIVSPPARNTVPNAAATTATNAVDVITL